jgi:bacteriocin-like protein
MPHKMEQQSQDTQQSTEQQSQELEKKELTLEDLASVTGGFLSQASLAGAKAEDRSSNKAEAE